MIATQVKAQATIDILKGTRAPFNGKLMPDQVFDQVNADLDAGAAMTKELQSCQSEKAQCVTAQESDSSKWFAAGGLTGVIFTFVIYNLVKK